jgi:hypothetical protein
LPTPAALILDAQPEIDKADRSRWIVVVCVIRYVVLEKQRTGMDPKRDSVLTVIIQADRMHREDVAMNSQNADSIAGDEQTIIQMMPVNAADGALISGTIEERGVDELVDYGPVPPRRIITISVRYRNLGRGRPLLYPLEEETEE